MSAPSSALGRLWMWLHGPGRQLPPQEGQKRASTATAVVQRWHGREQVARRSRGNRTSARPTLRRIGDIACHCLHYRASMGSMLCSGEGSKVAQDGE